MNPTLRPAQAVLAALSVNLQSAQAIAARAGLGLEQTGAALAHLVEAGLAIPEGDQYELSGPLSWFGTFGAAQRYYARRRLLLAANGKPEAHVYLADVRVKTGPPAGDPLTQTVAVFGCGRTASDVRAATADDAFCEDCRSVDEG